MIQLFQFVDGLLPLSGTFSVCLWAGLAGILSMLLYQRFSPQDKLVALMEKLQVAQWEMNDYDGEFDGLLPLLKTTIGLRCNAFGCR